MKKLIIPFLENISDWHKLKPMTDFSYPWQKTIPPRTHFTAFHDKDHLYFKFYAEGPQPIIFRKDNHKLEVTKSERVEIFFTKDLILDPYYCFEIDPIGRVLDYEARHYRIFNRKWKWPGDLQIETEIKEAFYTVSGRFEKSILSELSLLQSNELYAGLYRGHCLSLNGDIAKINWMSWVNSGTVEPDFHVPSSFGRFFLEPQVYS